MDAGSAPTEPSSAGGPTALAKRCRLLELAALAAALAGSACDGKPRSVASDSGAPEPPASALPACAFREPRCTPPPRRRPFAAIVDSADSRQPPYADPGRPIPYYVTYVGMHRYAEKTGCPLPMAWDHCRDYRLGDLHYDEQQYLIRIRIHREGRGGKPFKPVLARTRSAELGMSKADFLARNPGPSSTRQVQDPEFGAMEVLAYPWVEYEIDRVGGTQIVGAIVFQ